MRIDRTKRRWTLSGLMLQIVVMAVLLALYRHLEEWQREYELDIVLMSIDRQLREHPELGCFGSRSSNLKQEYFEYGSDSEEPPK
jgi:hypothetical protein